MTFAYPSEGLLPPHLAFFFVCFNLSFHAREWRGYNILSPSSLIFTPFDDFLLDLQTLFPYATGFSQLQFLSFDSFFTALLLFCL